MGAKNFMRRLLKKTKTAIIREKNKDKEIKIGSQCDSELNSKKICVEKNYTDRIQNNVEVLACKEKDDRTSEDECDYILDGRYKYVYDIYETRTGFIFGVNDLKTGITYALKTTPEQGRYMPNESAPNELQILRDLSKIDGVVKVFDSFLESQQYCLVFRKELTDVGSMLEKKSDHKFSQQTCLNLVYKLVVIIEKIHEAGYIHRDIKPNSLLITHNHDLLLSGFQLGFQFRKLGVFDEYYPSQEPSFRRDYWSYFSSPNAVTNSPQDGIDDLISIFFCFLTFRGYNTFKSLSYSEILKFLKTPDDWVGRKDRNLIPLFESLLKTKKTGPKRPKPDYNSIYEALNTLDPSCHFNLPLNIVDDSEGLSLN